MKTTVLFLFLALTVCASANEVRLRACSIKNDESKVESEVSGHRLECGDAKMSSGNTAIVLVDIWKQRDPSREQIQTGLLLEKMRDNDFFVVHAAGDAVFRYPQYHEYAREVERFLGDDYCKGADQLGNENRQKLYGARLRGYSCPRVLKKGYTDEISPLVAPVSGRAKEFFVRYEDELRYFLFKNGVKNLIYVGGAIDKCIVRRPYGINILVGTENQSYDYAIYLITDLSTSIENVTEGINQAQKNQVLASSLTYNRAVQLTNSDSFRFTTKNDKTKQTARKH